MLIPEHLPQNWDSEISSALSSRPTPALMVHFLIFLLLSCFRAGSDQSQIQFLRLFFFLQVFNEDVNIWLPGKMSFQFAVKAIWMIVGPLLLILSLHHK